MNPENLRKDFPLFDERPGISYLDNAATSQKPEQVIQAVSQFYRKDNSNIGRGLYDLANDATQAYESSRDKVADFIGAEVNEVVFVRNTTEGQNLVAETLNFDGNIVLSEMAHHSEQLPWRDKAERDGKELDYLRTEDGKISVKDAREKIDSNTGLVAISHISNVFGAINPVKEIIEIAHRNNALVMLDCAQSAPHLNLNVKQLDADFITFSGHKMLGPTGIGVVYGKHNLLQDMSPYQVGGGMVKSVGKTSVSYEDSPHRFEAGTPHIAGAIGLKTAIEYLEEIGMENIEKHSKILSKQLREGLEAIDSVEIISPRDAILVSFYSENIHSHDLAEVLNQKNVTVRAGNHCAQPQHVEFDLTGTTRASPYIYNTEEDVEKLLKATKEAVKLFDV